jgi:Rieske Fe-S protein
MMMTEQPQRDTHASRRGVLLGAGVIGIGALAGCSTAFVPYDANEAGKPDDAAGVAATESHDAAAGIKPGSSPTASPSASPSSSPKTKRAKTTSSGGDSGSVGTLLADVSAIPVGEGTIFAAQKVVVTQPTAGVFKAFSAVCTHAGCILDKVVDGNIYCPCHGAIFAIVNGAPIAGPTSIPLPAEQITVTDGKITLQ